MVVKTNNVMLGLVQKKSWKNISVDIGTVFLKVGKERCVIDNRHETSFVQEAKGYL